MRIQAHTSNSKLYDQSRPGRCRNAFSLQVKFTGLAPIHAAWCAWTQTVGHAKPAMQINLSSNPSRTPCHANDNRAGNTSSSILTMKTWNRGAERIVDVLGKSDGPRSVDRLSQSQPSRIRGTEEAKPPYCRRAFRRIAQRIPGTHVESPKSRNRKSRMQRQIGRNSGDSSAASADIAPMAISQHIPAKFSLVFADRLNRLCGVEVREAIDGG
jgi:hypothetical protein